ncbi:DEAD/DEAH box helicase family protein [Streptomyces sp. H27-D2]|uniref:DEAD/DEAH box helicase family protein n=1 Tax=Streptomyces sp. H27-D2 TaxID=3046304 RepID=UPI002DB9BC1E|nr:DEAD/DEAH box helicase family protein [Streptomyces sp. H27-D2]MEC4017961.1 DEAD/DEAH box helicase family protein [Streptomyces sp. H27-D2]
MSGKELFPHQVEAVDAVLRVLQTPAGGLMPPQGLRTQVIAATGSGKTLMGAAPLEGPASLYRSRSFTAA